ncbi:MAG: hypothetical protein NC400_04790 [Clostridium sp.]|nr:hypothetical protein [Clostridium sp.]
MLYSLEGIWKADLDGGITGEIKLPGTLDESGLGHKDAGANQWHPEATIGNAEKDFDPDAPIATRFTRKHTYEGEARLTRRISFNPPEGKRVFLEAERARCLKLLVDGKETPDFVQSSISTPHVFEVTGLLNGDNELTLLSDNSYPGLPHDAIAFSSAATDETQTNWNGVLGILRLRVEEPVFLSAVRAYPKKDTLTVQAEISAAEPYSGNLRISSAALREPVSKQVSVAVGVTLVEIKEIPLADGVRRWDEYEGNLYELTAELSGFEEKRITFGVRDFGDDGKGRLAINGRPFFLRSEANCAEFPETGHPPMTVEEWLTILETYKSYGINCMRFHSHCPPEAAFTAADRIGMMMQPELSHWNPQNALEPEDSYAYYQAELLQIIRTLANHPSFVMLTLGNELCTGKTGHERMSILLDKARELDDTRLYANGSNVHYGTIGCDSDSDFYTSQSFYREPLRGIFAGMPDLMEREQKRAQGETEETAGARKENTETPKIRIKGYINNQYPNAKTNYDASMACLRKDFKKPVFSFEVGQFEVLPYFEELADFHGISDPANYRLIQEKAEKLGLLKEWNRYVEATGELSRIGYREEIEAAMRTKELSGISLLGLQDFPGQGTALVGMLDSHLKPKPFDFARPEAFQAFFRESLPLVLLEKYTYEAGETLSADIQVANFGKNEICGEVRYELKGKDIIIEGTLPEARCPFGENTVAGRLEIPLTGIEKAARLDLTVSVGDNAEVVNTYPVWVYPPVKPVCPKGVYETRHFDERAREALAAGGRVYLSPDSTPENLPASIQAQFTTDFWSVGTFPMQEGGMGQLIEENHPIFEGFPTEFHTNWQWWPMAGQRAVILPRAMKSIVTEMDSYAYMRPMAQLLECRCGGGKLLLSSMGLQNLLQYPEARALLSSIYDYLGSEKFEPEQVIEPEEIAGLVR